MEEKYYIHVKKYKFSIGLLFYDYRHKYEVFTTNYFFMNPVKNMEHLLTRKIKH